MYEYEQKKKCTLLFLFLFVVTGMEFGRRIMKSFLFAESEHLELQRLHPNAISSEKCLDHMKEQEKYLDSSPQAKTSRQIRE